MKFAVCSADRKFTYVEIGWPGVCGGANILQRSHFLQNIGSGNCLGPDIPDLNISGVVARPYLLGNCAFLLQTFKMRKVTATDIVNNPALCTFDDAASVTRKPIECAFRVLKNRFKVLKAVFHLRHDNDIARIIHACALLKNLPLRDGDDRTESYELDVETNTSYDDCTGERNYGKRQRYALIYYLNTKLYSFSS